MLPKLELDSLYAEMAGVQAVLSASSIDEDPVGFMQFEERYRELSEMIGQVGEQSNHKAQIAAFFGGSPVVGSRGIHASFLAKATEGIQDIVDKQFAAEEFGTLAERGPVKNRKNTRLMVTDVLRGSFGIVLEEVSQNTDLMDTSLKKVVDEVAELIIKIGTATDEDFNAAVEVLDERSLSSVISFFELLKENEATIRLVYENQDTLLDGPSIIYGFERINKISIRESETDSLTGKLHWIPSHRKFELEISGSTEIVYGSVSADLIKAYREGILSAGGGVSERVWKTKMKIRSVEQAGRKPRKIYTLLGLLQD